MLKNIRLKNNAWKRYIYEKGIYEFNACMLHAPYLSIAQIMS